MPLFRPTSSTAPALPRPAALSREVSLAVCLLGVAAVLAAPQAARAQAVPPGVQQLERIQQEQQERTQRQFERDRESARPPTNLQPVTPDRPAPTRAPSVCRDIQVIVLDGALSLSSGKQAELVRPYVGKCLDAALIERLMGDVTAHYIERGMIAARVYLGPQDLATGKLTLTVVEGVLESIRTDDSISKATAFPGMVGKPLNLRDVEQGLDQINRLLSNNARMAVEPGSEAGASVLAITNEPSKRWRVNLSADNAGSESTGDKQGSVGFGFDNPLGLNDSVNFTDRRTLNEGGGRRDSQSDSLSYVVPYGYNTFSVGVSRTTYKTTLDLPGGSSIVSDGDSRTAYLRADRVIFRNKDHLLTLAGTLTRKESNNYLAGEYLDVASRTLTVGDLDLSLRSTVWGGVATFGLGWSQGLDALGALKDEDGLPDEAPRAQFGKARLNAGWMQFAEVAPGRTLDFSSQLSAQFSKDVLYGTEQMLIGSVYSVRGFSDSSLSNDQGLYLRNELGLRNAFQAGQFSGNWRVYAGLDAGYVRGRHGDGDSGTLVGAALGVSVNVGKASVDTFLMTPISRPSWLAKDDTRLQVALSYAF